MTDEKEKDTVMDCECQVEEKKKSRCCKKDKNNKEVEELTIKLAEMTDKCARAQAEVINFKRRMEEQTSLRLKYCNQDILLSLVQVVDNFERAIKLDDDNLNDELSKFLVGFKMIYSNMLDILKQNEIEEIEVLNKPFDPNTSEAIIVEHFDEREPHEVVDVMQKGYMYKDRILRPAMVKIND